MPVDRAPRDGVAGWQGGGARIFPIGRADQPGISLEQKLRPSLCEASADAELLCGLAQGRATLVKQRGQASVLILSPGKGAWHRQGVHIYRGYTLDAGALQTAVQANFPRL